jgi:hypothetical protein
MRELLEGVKGVIAALESLFRAFPPSDRLVVLIIIVAGLLTGGAMALQDQDGTGPASTTTTVFATSSTTAPGAAEPEPGTPRDFDGEDPCQTHGTGGVPQCWAG